MKLVSSSTRNRIGIKSELGEEKEKKKNFLTGNAVRHARTKHTILWIPNKVLIRFLVVVWGEGYRS